MLNRCGILCDRNESIRYPARLLQLQGLFFLRVYPLFYVVCRCAMKRTLIFLIFSGQLLLGMVPAVSLGVSGCARLGPALQRPTTAPAESPEWEQIFRDLKETNAAFTNFRSVGSVRLESPDLVAVQRLRQSTVTYIAPAQLHIEGRKYGVLFFRLTAHNDAYLIEYPREKKFIYEEHGRSVEGIEGRVSPAMLARESFFTAEYLNVPPRRIRKAEMTESHAVFEILSRSGRVQRRVYVSGPSPWVITRAERYDHNGDLVAVSEWSDYRAEDSFRYPAQIHVVFPKQQAMIEFQLRKITRGIQAEPAIFDLRARVKHLLSEKYVQIEPEEAPTLSE